MRQTRSKTLRENSAAGRTAGTDAEGKQQSAVALSRQASRSSSKGPMKSNLNTSGVSQIAGKSGSRSRSRQLNKPLEGINL